MIIQCGEHANALVRQVAERAAHDHGFSQRHHTHCLLCLAIDQEEVRNPCPRYQAAVSLLELLDAQESAVRQADP